MAGNKDLDVCVTEVAADEGRHVLVVRGALCLENSRLLSVPVQRLISRGDTRRIEIDCAGVTKVDPASVHLLRILRERGLARSQHVCVVNPSARFRVSRFFAWI